MASPVTTSAGVIPLPGSMLLLPLHNSASQKPLLQTSVEPQAVVVISVPSWLQT